MKMFVFKEVAELTARFHPEGGLVVVAKDLEQVKELIEKLNELGELECKLTQEELDQVVVFELDESKGPYATQVVVFPNAGCC